MTLARNQHYVPQFLLKGFLVLETDNQTWVYRHDRTFQTNIRNVGSQRDFYGHRDQETADFAIEAAEQEISKLLAELRSGLSRPIDRLTADPVVRHFLSRTNNARSFAFQVMAGLIDSANELLSDPITALAQLEEMILADPQFLTDFDLSELRKNNRHLDQEEMASLRKLISDNLPQILANGGLSILSRMQSELTALHGQLGEIAEGAHITAMKRVSEQSTFAGYDGFNWRLHVQSNAEFILGDCCVVALDQDSIYQHPFDLSPSKTDAILLPVGTKRVLIGEQGLPISAAMLSALNEASARYSREFFVSSFRKTELKRLMPLIGSYAPRHRLESLFPKGN